MWDLLACGILIFSVQIVPGIIFIIVAIHHDQLKSLLSFTQINLVHVYMWNSPPIFLFAERLHRWRDFLVHGYKPGHRPLVLKFSVKHDKEIQCQTWKLSRTGAMVQNAYFVSQNTYWFHRMYTSYIK